MMRAPRPAPHAQLDRSVTRARAAWRRPLPASLALATLATLAVLGAAPPGSVGAPAAPVHEPGCTSSACVLEPPTPGERDALRAEADRLLAAYADDATSLGRQCHALGATMRARADEVRMLRFMWRAVDPDGNLAAVTGDAHRVEPAAGTGRVHIARGYDALNPERGLPAILQTARHEFAHLNGMEQRERWGVDEGAQLAAACRPPDER